MQCQAFWGGGNTAEMLPSVIFSTIYLVLNNPFGSPIDLCSVVSKWHCIFQIGDGEFQSKALLQAECRTMGHRLSVSFQT